MPSSYTSSLRLTLPATGELTGTWGTTVNTGITELLDSAVAGTASISTWGGAGVPYTLSNTDGAADEARKMFIVATGAPGEAKNVICPAVSKLYFFRNDTTGGFALTLKTSGGSGIAVPAGQYKVLYCNGTDVVEAFNSLASLTLGTALAVTSGGTGTTTSTGTGSVVLSNSPALTTPNLGIPSAATLTNATGLPLTTGVTGTLAASNGGTGQSAYTTGDLIYATGATTLAKLGIGASTNVLTSSGSAPQWAAASSVAIGTATNIAGGTGGSVPYQSGAATTTFLGIGAANTVMTSSGTAPQWSTALTGLTGVSTTTATLSSDLTLTGGTANGVLYLNGSKVATSGSALTFDGTTFFRNGANSAFATIISGVSKAIRIGMDSAGGYIEGVDNTGTGSYQPLFVGGSDLRFLTSGSEQMRLTSTGLGIGTSSPNRKLEVNGISRFTDGTSNVEIANGGGVGYVGPQSNHPLAFQTNNVERMRLDASGNLGLGVAPSAWSTTANIQLATGRNISAGTGIGLYGNAYFDAGWKYIDTTYATGYGQSGGAHVWYTAPSGTAGNAISFTQAMTLSAGGDLFLGATGAAFAERFRMNGAYAVFDDASYTGFIGRGTALGTATASDFAIRSSNALAFLTGGATERARITSGGDLLVGNNASVQSSRAEFTSTSLVPAFLARVNVDADESQWAGQFQKKTNTNTTSQIFVRFLINDGATPSGYITANGANAATFTSSSDERLKENIADLPSQLASIQSLRPVEFDFKDGSGHQIGFIAQELQTVYPDCVSEGADGMLQIGGWSKTEARLVKAIQEQQAIIDSLKARLDAANL